MIIVDISKAVTIDLNGNKVRLEALGEGVVKDKNIELRIFIATPKLMKEIEEWENQL